MRRELTANQVVVLTGAASGIGRATALACAKRGAALALCDLDEERLDQTAGDAQKLGATRVLREVRDVGSAEAVRAFAERVTRELGPADLLVNNAGVAVFGGFLHTSLDDWRWITETNYWGVVHGCHYFLPPMVERGRGGHVVNVASAAGFVASEALAAYSTTKYAVVGLSEALRDELARHEIGVSVICPGFVNTPIVERMRVRGVDAPDALRARVGSWYRKRNYDPERVAESILDAVRDNRAIVPVAPEAHLLHAMKRLLPSLSPRLLRLLGELAGPEKFG
jgi:NAD(P)-dependent dehydrogenase (short-subunit alcohol dehydrogenase family)